jgi:MtN3 and saliva related transmembrane protein
MRRSRPAWPPVSTTLDITAASWALVMALTPILQMREILRRDSSEGLAIGYFAIMLVGFGLWIAYGVARHDIPVSSPTASPCSS